MSNNDEIRIYWLHEDGGYELVTTLSIGYLGGTLPNVGDVLALWEPVHWLEVTSRHFIAHSIFDRGWALIGKRVDRSRNTKILVQQWLQDTHDLAEATRDDEDATPDEPLERDNRDPAYWTPERKEILRKEREAMVAAIKAAEAGRT